MYNSAILVLEALDLGSGLAFDSLEQSIALLKNIELFGFAASCQGVRCKLLLSMVIQ